MSLLLCILPIKIFKLVPGFQSNVGYYTVQGTTKPSRAFIFIRLGLGIGLGLGIAISDFLEVEVEVEE